MSERFGSSPEKYNNRTEKDVNRSEVQPEENAELTAAVEAYLAEQPGPLTEFADKQIDDVLSRYIEEGPELSPDVKASLRKTIQFILGTKVQK